MKSTRNRSAWVLLTVAVMVIATAARVEAGGSSASAYASPVLEFLTGHSSANSLSSHHVPQLFKNWSTSRAAASAQSGNSGVWQSMLPVLFIGLVAPLNLLLAHNPANACRVPSAPALPSAFQRPPPSLLA